MKLRLVFDLDGVIARGGKPYADCVPYPDAVRHLRVLKAFGHTIVIQTARGMAELGGDQAAVLARGTGDVERWLLLHGVPFDEVYVGKASGDRYVDDRAFRLRSDAGTAEWTRLLESLDDGSADVLAVGDVVELKSGGPPMTVVEFDPDGSAILSYFDEDGDPADACFPAGCLSVTERRWTGLTEEEVARAAAEEEDDDDD